MAGSASRRRSTCARGADCACGSGLATEPAPARARGSRRQGPRRMQYSTLIEILETNRDAPRAIHYLEGEHDERVVPFGELYQRALGILWHLQRLGADRGDKLIVFLNHNEQFIDGFWAALSGGIVPVPLAVGISDEHRHKLLRVARKLGNPLLYTDAKSLERLEGLAAQVGEADLFAQLKSRAFLVESITDISKPGKLFRPAPQDLAF